MILGPFAEQCLNTLDVAQLDIYEMFLEEFDSDIWDWLVDKNSDYDAKYDALIRQLKQFAHDRQAL